MAILYLYVILMMDKQKRQLLFTSQILDTFYLKLIRGELHIYKPSNYIQ